MDKGLCITNIYTDSSEIFPFLRVPAHTIYFCIISIKFYTKLIDNILVGTSLVYRKLVMPLLY